MAFFGMYPNKYIGGGGLAHGFRTPVFYSGVHPSSISSGNINYFSGAKNASSVQTVPNTIQTAVQPQTVNVQNPVQDSYVPQTDAARLQNMQNVLDNAKNEQGVFGKLIDGVKGMTGLGLSSKKCQSYIDSVKTGSMSYEEAYSKVSKYSSKQKNAVNILTGISSGVITTAALGFAPVTGGASILAAAGIGAASKAGLKTIDRATNNIQNDALDAKQIAKDGLTGAIDGAVSAATVGIGKEAVMGAKTSKEALKQGAIAGAKGGAISGAVIGAGDYTVECAFEDDQKFEVDNLITNTVYGAAVGAITGAVIGGIQSGKNFKNHNSDSPKTGNKNDDTPKAETKDAPESPKNPKAETQPENGSSKPRSDSAQNGSTGNKETIDGDREQPSLQTEEEPVVQPSEPSKAAENIQQEKQISQDTHENTALETSNPVVDTSKAQTEQSSSHIEPETIEVSPNDIIDAPKPETHNQIIKDKPDIIDVEAAEVASDTVLPASSHPETEITSAQPVKDTSVQPAANADSSIEPVAAESAKPLEIVSQTESPVVQNEGSSIQDIKQPVESTVETVETEPVKENISNLITRRRQTKAPKDPIAERTKTNAANVINSKKQGRSSKIKALFGSEE